MECGGCGGGQTCGGGGLPSVCGAAADSGVCTPTSCTQPNGQYCGVIGNGCGGSVDCGSTCPAGQVCGARTPNVCNAPCPLCGQIPQCAVGTTTTISGTAVTGALSNPHPLYGALVYIPNRPSPPILDRATCDR